jgi:hypothetical protein
LAAELEKLTDQSDDVLRVARDVEPRDDTQMPAGAADGAPTPTVLLEGSAAGMKLIAVALEDYS